MKINKEIYKLLQNIKIIFFILKNKLSKLINLLKWETLHHHHVVSHNNKFYKTTFINLMSLMIFLHLITLYNDMETSSQFRENKIWKAISLLPKTFLISLILKAKLVTTMKDSKVRIVNNFHLLKFMVSNKWNKITSVVLGNGIMWSVKISFHLIRYQQDWLFRNVFIYFLKLLWDFSIFTQNKDLLKSLKKWLESIQKEKLKFGWIKIMAKIILRIKRFSCILQKILNHKTLQNKNKVNTFWKDKWSEKF